MREIRTSGSEGGVVSSITIPTPIRARLSLPIPLKGKKGVVYS